VLFLLAQTRPDAAAHIEVLYEAVLEATWASPRDQILDCQIHQRLSAQAQMDLAI